MEALAALAGGLGSVFGSLMNTSSQQSINAANLQQQMAIASGAQLPGLVANAKKAGLNPLAVLGQSAPGGMAAVGTQPGAAAAAGGASLVAAAEAYRRDQMADQLLAKAKIDVANARVLGNNMAIQGARDKMLNRQMETYFSTHPMAVPTSSGPQEASLAGAGVDWLHEFFHTPWGPQSDRPVTPFVQRWPGRLPIGMPEF